MVCVDVYTFNYTSFIKTELCAQGKKKIIQQLEFVKFIK